MPIYKAKGSCYNNNRRPSRRTNLASLTRLGKHSLPLGLLSLKPSLRRWLTKKFIFPQKKKMIYCYPFFFYTELSSFLFWIGGWLFDGGRSLWEILFNSFNSNRSKYFQTWEEQSMLIFTGNTFVVTNTHVCLCGQKGVYTDSESNSFKNDIWSYSP